MENFDALIDAVKAALRTAGFGNVTSRASDPGTLVSAEKGTAGATFYVTPQTAAKATATPIAAGGRDPAAHAEDAAFVPVVPDAAKMIAADPDTASRLLGLSRDVALSLDKPAASA